MAPASGLRGCCAVSPPQFSRMRLEVARRGEFSPGRFGLKTHGRYQQEKLPDHASDGRQHRPLHPPGDGRRPNSENTACAIARAAGTAVPIMDGAGAGARGAAEPEAEVGAVPVADARPGPPLSGCGQPPTRPGNRACRADSRPGTRRVWRSFAGRLAGASQKAARRPKRHRVAPANAGLPWFRLSCASFAPSNGQPRSHRDD